MIGLCGCGASGLRLSGFRVVGFMPFVLRRPILRLKCVARVSEKSLSRPQSRAEAEGASRRYTLGPDPARSRPAFAGTSEQRRVSNGRERRRGVTGTPG